VITRSKLTGLGLGLIATVFWASLYVVTRLVFGNFHVDPLALTFIRFLMASVFFVGVILLTGQGRRLYSALRERFWTLVFLGLVGVFGEGVTQFYSLQYTTAARSCLFANTSPILTVCLAALVLKEPIRKHAVLGMTIGFAAMILGIAGRPGSDLYMEESRYSGDLLALLSAVCWAAYTVGGERVTRRYGGLISASAAMLLGTAITWGFLRLTGRPVFPRMPASVWWGMAYLGVGASGLAYVAWFSALRYLKAGELGAFGYVSTMLTTAMAVILVNERISGSFLLALAGVLVGVWLMTMTPLPASAAKLETIAAPERE
jgi:drug/metabolite transporter (DMT)-like permease